MRIHSKNKKLPSDKKWTNEMRMVKPHSKVLPRTIRENETRKLNSTNVGNDVKLKWWGGGGTYSKDYQRNLSSPH